MEARGRNLNTGLPVSVKLHSSEIMDALIEPAMQIVSAVKSILEKNATRINSRY